MYRHQSKMSSSKKIDLQGDSATGFYNRVYRLEIQSVMLVFSTKLCELLPCSSLSGTTPPLPGVKVLLLYVFHHSLRMSPMFPHTVSQLSQKCEEQTGHKEYFCSILSFKGTFSLLAEKNETT
jgi:hypothetical protein